MFQSHLLTLVKPNNFSIGNLPNKSHYLESIHLSYCKEKLDLSELDQYKKSLKEIRISNSKNIINYEALGNLESLEIVVFTDCNEIDSAVIFSKLPNLKQLTILGKSFFKDGNIDCLIREGLTVGIDNKKHYTKKYSDFKNYYQYEKYR